MTIERIYRIRYLHRGAHPILTAMQLKDMLWLNLRPPAPTALETGAATAGRRIDL